MTEQRKHINTKDLNIREMLLGNPNRLRFVIRFSTCRRTHDESVAEHSYYTAFYSMMVSEWVLANRPDVRLNTAQIMASALVHDLEECRSGDFPRPFKYSSKELKDHLDGAAVIAFEQVIESLLSNNKRAIEEWTGLWANAKSDTYEGRIVEFADFLSSAAYICQELAANNRSMSEHTETMQEYFATFLRPEYNFMRELVNQFKDVFDEFFPEYAIQHIRRSA